MMHFFTITLEKYQIGWSHFQTYLETFFHWHKESKSTVRLVNKLFVIGNNTLTIRSVKWNHKNEQYFVEREKKKSIKWTLQFRINGNHIQIDIYRILCPPISKLSEYVKNWKPSGLFNSADDDGFIASGVRISSITCNTYTIQ